MAIRFNVQTAGNKLRSLGSKVSALEKANDFITAYGTVLTTDYSEKNVEVDQALANDMTVPPHSEVPFPVGTTIILIQKGAGQTTIVAGSGVTLRAAGGKLKLTSQFSAATLIKKDQNIWYVFGDLSA